MKHLFSMLLLAAIVVGCEKQITKISPLDTIPNDEFYPNEMLSTEYCALYGKWNLTDVTGGFSGAGHTPQYDYIEFRPFGIYGIVRDNELIEYGKVTIDTFDIENQQYLQLTFTPNSYENTSSKINPSNQYLEIKSKEMNMLSPCCDMFNYHFTLTD